MFAVNLVDLLQAVPQSPPAVEWGCLKATTLVPMYAKLKTAPHAHVSSSKYPYEVLVRIGNVNLACEYSSPLFYKEPESNLNKIGEYG